MLGRCLARKQILNVWLKWLKLHCSDEWLACALLKCSLVNYGIPTSSEVAVLYANLWPCWGRENKVENKFAKNQPGFGSKYGCTIGSRTTVFDRPVFTIIFVVMEVVVTSQNKTLNKIKNNNAPLAFFRFYCLRTWKLNGFWFSCNGPTQNTPNCWSEIRKQLVLNNSQK